MAVGMRATALAAVALCASAAPAQADVRITRDHVAGEYARYDNASDAGDAVLAACSTGRRPQSGPSVAIDPRAPDVVVAGANDYCPQAAGSDLWAGFYRSTDGGQTWRAGLVPGYPGDDSPAGRASPTTGSCSAAADPTQSFDGEGRLFYGFNCFNRAHPANESIYVATYDGDGAEYVRTVQVASGTPGDGLFQGRTAVVADPASGNVYVAWSRFSGAARNNVLYFSRSTDHGASFSRPQRVTQGLGSEQFADMGLAPDGTVYLTYRTFLSVPESTTDAIWLTRSSDGGVSFDDPQKVADIAPFDSIQFSGGGAVFCGDGPFACPSGLTFSRFLSFSAVAADASGVHVVWSAERPSGQAKIFVRSSPDGVTFPDLPAPIDSVPAGHQWFPDVASAGGVLSVVFYDSRADPAYSPALPPGNTVAGTNSGDVVDTYVARSMDGGATWSEQVVSAARSNFGWETHANQQVGFAGDSIYVSAVAGVVNVVWTDSRDLVPGTDPRDEPGDEDGFDVFTMCSYEPEPPSVDDPCLNHGGLDQNVYGARLP